MDSYNLIKNSEENRELLKRENRCDKYDAIVAVVCGVLGAVTDIFMVGMPGGHLDKWTDEQTKRAVKSFAGKVGWKPRENQKDSVASAIGYLEKKYKVNYDQRYSSDVEGLFQMSTKNHHMVSLSHSPDIVGLFFSVLNQFTSTSSFLAEGQLITVRTDDFELQGSNLIAKLFCGIVNWFGHIMSDIAGSSGSAGSGSRGIGIVLPFYELFRLCRFGQFNVGKDKQDLSVIATRAFQEGYDFRHGCAMGIPVLITDLSIRTVWGIRRYFQYGKELRECIPTSQYSDLRVMLLCGNGTLCVLDGTDAVVRSGGNCLLFFKRWNLIAWCRFAMLVVKELCICVGMGDVLEKELYIFKQLDEAVTEYLNQIKQIDVARFALEKEKYKKMTEQWSEIHSQKELQKCLCHLYEDIDIEFPWEGEFEYFDAAMGEKSGKLVFK